jgi:hypothetical protein
MITNAQAAELLQLTSTIHFQILREHGTIPDQAHTMALTALHELLCSMVSGEDVSQHGRWAFAAPIGFGKSSGVAAFLSAAHQLQLLGNGITITLTASRVEQLYDFEDALLDAGIPQADIGKLVAVIHDVKKNVKRESDNDRKDAPILMVAHNRIRKVYRREEQHLEKDLTWFLKCGADKARDFVLWDERCQRTEVIHILVKNFKEALDALCGKVEERPELSDLCTWLRSCLAYINAENVRMLAKSPDAISEADGLLTHMPAGDVQKFYGQIQSCGLNGDNRRALTQFVELLRFKLRVVPTQQAGIITYHVVVPDCMTNCLVLDASYGVSELTPLDPSIKNAEEHLPRLKQMKAWYRKGLADLKDCSDHEFQHWDTGAGKDKVASDLKDYLAGKAVGGNLILEIVEKVKTYSAQGRNILIWTHKHDRTGTNLVTLLVQALEKGGCDLTKMVRDRFSKGHPERPQIVVSNYGQHDANNSWTYCDVVIHLGIQERQDAELAGAMCGQLHSLGSRLTHAQIKSVKVSEKAATLQQSTGRGQCRVTVNGKSLPQISIVIFSSSRDNGLTEKIQAAFPKSRWSKMETKYVVEEVGLIETWVKKVETYLETELKDKLSSRSLKRVLKGDDIASATWTKVTKLVSDRSITWKGEGQSMVRQKAENYGFTIEAVAETSYSPI